MIQTQYTYYYFLGIGGIGMSALARYFNQQGAKVFGYDRTQTDLTRQLESEGIAIHYTDTIALIPHEVLEHKSKSIVIYTPAIPANHAEYAYLQSLQYTCVKRAYVLGLICNPHIGIAIAGTHGKTSVSTFTAHMLYHSHIGCNAFLGGISKNFATNYVLHSSSDYVVVEADEYDRSFHHLHPHTALITSMDADHLDIYQTHQHILQSFYEFALQIKPQGALVYKYGLPLQPILQKLYDKSIKTFTYSVDNADADFYALDIQVKEHMYLLSLHTPYGTISGIEFRLPGTTNIENMIAASAVALVNGITPAELQSSIACLQGVVRRFDIRFSQDTHVYIDDYAHHPEELRACISSLKNFYGNKKITGIFQPHLYSRTKDFAKEFGESLSLLDELILLDIYPAREEPIPGVSSQLIFDAVQIDKKTLCAKHEVMELLKNSDIEILVTMGAGDIDTLVSPITSFMEERFI